MNRVTHQDTYLIFDRYFDFSIKSGARAARAGGEASRQHKPQLQTQLPPQKVALTVIENRIQIIDLIARI